jgi:hypothetical protein
MPRIEGIVEKAGAFPKQFTAKDDIAGLIDDATKPAQSVRAHIVEFLPEKISVGTMSGFIADGDSLSADVDSLENFRLIRNLDRTQWQTFSLKLTSDHAGPLRLAASTVVVGSAPFHVTSAVGP